MAGHSTPSSVRLAQWNREGLNIEVLHPLIAPRYDGPRPVLL